MGYSNFDYYSDFNELTKIKKGTLNPWFNNYIKSLKNLSINNNVVEINKNNSDIIENDLSSNEDYKLNLLKIVFHYYGGKQSFNKYDLESVTALLRIIDLENSTNLWRMKHEKRQTLKNIASYIVDKSTGFWNRLGDSNELNLVDDLIKVGIKGKGNPGVTAKSFASKVCKYIDELYGGNCYFINDDVVRRVLPYYLCKYNVQIDIEKRKGKKKANGNYKYDFDNMSYVELFKCLEALKNKADPTNTLSKTEFDHILWYSYRFEKI